MRDNKPIIHFVDLYSSFEKNETNATLEVISRDIQFCYNTYMKIALFTGGTTGERLVSIASANNIKKLIDFAEVETFILPMDTEKFLQDYKQFDLAIPMIHGKDSEDGTLQGFLETLSIPYIFSGVGAHAIGIDTDNRTIRIGPNGRDRCPSII
jgi:hypothetical protein